jgi:ABC-type antimicrobial peptide transport system permease subunit
MLFCMSPFTTGQFLRRSLRHHIRSHIAVALGVVVAAMVIGGALIVGDSVRDSLRRLTLERLSAVDHALVSHRFFREESIAALKQQPGYEQKYSREAPALVFPASVERRRTGDDASAQSMTRASGVTLYGCDDRLWKGALDPQGLPAATADGIVLNSKLAAELRAKVGDDITVWVELPATIPRDSLLGGQEGPSSQELRLKVEGILPADVMAGRFSLQPSQQFPKVAFVDLRALQKSLELEAVEPGRNRVRKPARVNALFVSVGKPLGDSNSSHGTSRRISPQKSDIESAAELTRMLRDSLSLEDLHLRLVPNVERRYVSLESERMILEDAMVKTAEEIAAKHKLPSSPVLAYLTNEISRVGDDTGKKLSKYSIVAAVPEPSTLSAPFGPVGDVKLGKDGVLICDWLAADLGITTADLPSKIENQKSKIRIKYHKVGSKGELPEEELTFEVRGILPLDGKLAGDRGLTPTVPGITDAKTFNDWKQPFPMDIRSMPKRDDYYWDKYGATPKAFFEIEAAREWWSSRYGSATSLRIGAAEGESLEESTKTFEADFLKSLSMDAVGLAIQPVKFQGLQAASGTTEFSGLFIGFSFFMILSGLLLISLLVRLGIERRANEIGLLSAIGFSPSRIGRLLLREQFAIVLLGTLVGIVAAVGYAALLMYGLRTLWVGAVGTTELRLSVQLPTLLISFAGTLIAASASAWWGLRGLRKLSPRELLAGQTELAERNDARTRRRERLRKTAHRLRLLSVLLVAMTVFGRLSHQAAFFGLSWATVLFFVVGISALTSAVCSFAAWLDGDHFVSIIGSGPLALLRLSLRNATRQRRRSLMSLALIASSTFLLIAVAAGRRNPIAEAPDRSSGNGGFLFVAESNTPLIHDLNTPAGRVKLDLGNHPLFEEMTTLSFRVQPGENASCLNLFQTRVPTILGVPRELLNKDWFKFAQPIRGKSSPWSLLEKPFEDGAIPVIGDMNTLMYSLHKGVGDTVWVPDETNPKARLRIAAMLDSSIFQGVLLMSEEHFQSLFPERAGFRYFLIGDHRFQDGRRAMSKDDARDLSDLLETGLAPYGFDVEPIGNRLANFLAVQNTYLSTFQTLGGLGLLLGTFGLGTVMLRNVIERRAELALLRAVGFKPSAIRRLVLFENAFLLACGLFVGTTSALLAMLPHLLSTGADVPWLSGAGLLAGIFGVGLLAASAATAEAVRTPIVATLRGE